jgi:predicted Fe-Mo cluster-binding NifX family protein
MKVCVPTMGNKGMDELVSEHFGRAPTFTVVDTDTKKVEVLKNVSEHMGGSGVPPEHLSKAGVKIMLSSGMGPRAITMFQQFGIEVYFGACGTVRETIELWKGGKLPPATQEGACQEHRH